MPRVPIRQQNSQFGGVNAAGSVRAVPRYVVRQAGPALALEQFGDSVDASTARALNQIQQNARMALSQVKSSPFADGNLLENVALVMGNNVLQHGLGRPYRGWWLLSPSAAVTVYEVPQSPLKNASSQLTLNASAPCIASVWVYR